MSATSLAIGNAAVDETQPARLQRQHAVASIERLTLGVGQVGDLPIEDIVVMDGDDPEPPSRAAEILRIRIHADRVVRQLAQERAKVVNEGGVNVVGDQLQVGSRAAHQPGDLAAHRRADRDRGRVARIDQEERLDTRVRQPGQFGVGELKPVRFRRVHIDRPEAIIFELGYLQVWGEDRRGECDAIAGPQQPVGLERAEDAADRRRAALGREEIETAGWSRHSAHRLSQVLVHHMLCVHQHPVGHRIVVTDDRIGQLVDEGVWLEAESLHGVARERADRPGRFVRAMVGQPAVQPIRDSVGARNAGEAGRVRHHPR